MFPKARRTTFRSVFRDQGLRMSCPDSDSELRVDEAEDGRVVSTSLGADWPSHAETKGGRHAYTDIELGAREDVAVALSPRVFA